MNKKFYILLNMALFLVINLSAQITINEYSASNLNSFYDNFSKHEDWIELHNTSPSPVNLSGWYLSDKANNPKKWKIPLGITIPGNGYKVIWCSGRDTTMGSHLHTNFKLTQTKSNEFIVLSGINGNVIESFPVEITLLGHSQARETNGSNNWMICTAPTPGSSNNNAPKVMAYTQAPTMSLNPGFYEGEQKVAISTTEENVSIRYTLDGTAPTENSPEYTDTLTITETTIVKAQAFNNDPMILPGKMDFNTYFIDENFTLDVISVGADGIKDLANGNGDLRPIGSLEYFRNNQRTAIGYGELNRHGQDSWALPHRSIDWVTRDEMGYIHAVQEQLFSYSPRNEHQRIMMRASGDDNYPAVNDDNHEGSCHVRDEYVQTLAQKGGLHLDVRAVERIIVFLNGEYWGVYGMRERPVDHDYTKYYYNQEKFDLQFLATWGSSWAEYGGQGAFNDWALLRDFILNSDMSDSQNYQFVKNNLDPISLMDYMIVNLTCVASDWLNYNTGWWRGLNPNGGHQKWGYILWDNDATFDYYINYSGVPNTDPDAVPCDIEEISDYMDDFFGSPWNNPDIGLHEKIFLKLQEENEEFRQLYYSRQADLMNTVYTCENMITTFENMIAVIEPEMPRQIQRWGGSLQEWQQNVQQMRAFIEERCTLIDDGIVDCFEVTGPYNLTFMVEPEGVGEINLNTIQLDDFPWAGDYFGGMDNLIEAVAVNPNYQFLRWESKETNPIFPDRESANAAIQLTEPDTLVAVFGFATSTYELSDAVAISVFPTLVNDQLNIQFSLDKSMDIDVGLFNIVGKEVLHIDELNGKRTAGHYHHQINTTNLTPGIYLLNFRADDGQKTFKITVL